VTNHIKKQDGGREEIWLGGTSVLVCIIGREEGPSKKRAVGGQGNTPTVVLRLQEVESGKMGFW